MPVLGELENRPTLFNHETHAYTGWAGGSASDLGSLTEQRGRDKRPQPWDMPKGWYWIISLLLNRKNTNCLTLRSNNTSNNKTYNIYFIINNNRQNDKANTYLTSSQSSSSNWPPTIPLRQYKLTKFWQTAWAQKQANRMMDLCGVKDVQIQNKQKQPCRTTEVGKLNE